MLLGTTIAIAAGLNPYVTTLVVVALAGLASRVQLTGPFAEVDPTTWRTAIAVGALLAGLDLTVGKLRHRFMLMRRTSLAMSVIAGASGAVVGAGDSADPLMTAAFGALGATMTSLAVTRVARHAMDASSLLRLGHIPVLMAATVVAAISVPLTLTFGWPGTALGGVVAAAYAVSAARVSSSPKPSPPKA
jgi:hypothetical protein